MKLIHLTDPHFVSPGKRLYGLDPRARLDAAVKSINALHGDAAAVVITGDLAHWGEVAAYANLRDCLDRLTVPCIPLVGNHDDREAFQSLFPDAPRDEAGFVQGVQETPLGRLLFLDTNQPGTHMGWYCAQRLEWLAARLAEGGPVYVFMHHPPFNVGIGAMDRIGLAQRDAFFSVVGPHIGSIRHLFFGHVHRPISGSWLGVPFSTLRATNHQVALDFTAEIVIPGSHEPPAYGVILVDDTTVVVHQHDYLDDSRRFSLGEQTDEDRAQALDMAAA